MYMPNLACETRMQGSRRCTSCRQNGMLDCGEAKAVKSVQQEDDSAQTLYTQMASCEHS